MSAEERWAQQQEWQAERDQGFDVEINHRIACRGDFGCEVPHCGRPGQSEVEVRNLVHKYSVWVVLCTNHDDDDIAFGIYNERRDE